MELKKDELLLKFDTAMTDSFDAAMSIDFESDPSKISGLLAEAFTNKFKELFLNDLLDYIDLINSNVLSNNSES